MNFRFKIAGYMMLAAVFLMTIFVPTSKANVFDDPTLRLDSVTVNSTSGIPALYVNNVKTPAILFTQWKMAIPNTPITKYPNFEGDAKYAGIHIYQVRANVGSSVDKLQPLFDEVIANDPKARFLVTIWVASPYEMSMTANATNDANVDTTALDHVSFGSEKWRENGGLLVRQIVRDMNYSQYRDRVIGYMLTAGATGEWMDPNIFANTDFDRSLSNQIGFRNQRKIYDRREFKSGLE
ncbi:hypothetical protein [Cohnella silvisoli]|uniref:Uncharacterized protein n=1 Tax=Cohnella silvisoli TaxID=2873699 RepID=A0ABV1KTE8_9BACL|nr:hypothetical protein [Cohnella silvisoli]MCD9022448.1 hypothetical protein [Cohnella silvisoli]